MAPWDLRSSVSIRFDLTHHSIVVDRLPIDVNLNRFSGMTGRESRSPLVTRERDCSTDANRALTIAYNGEMKSVPNMGALSRTVGLQLPPDFGCEMMS
jgi:hypothetical protein